MLALKLEPLFSVPNPQESETTVLAEVECWHPLATANGSALTAGYPLYCETCVSPLRVIHVDRL